MNFDYSLEPGRKLEAANYKKHNPLVSVIIPFYNDEKYIEQSILCILNQTFPYFEVIIVDDGSKDKKSLNKLDEVSKLDDRIKVFHKKNEGLAATRDYGASKSCETSKYFLFIDSDDLIEKTYLECAYWALETNINAGWAYSDSVGFGTNSYLWNKWFDTKKEKKVNELLSMSLVRKEAYYSVNGYELREKAVNEDWNFWLKLISKGYYPIHMSFYGQWYRRKDTGSELTKSIQNRSRSLEIIRNTSKRIRKNVEAIQFPMLSYEKNTIFEKVENIIVPKKKKNNKINLLMFIPWMVTGGADFFNLDLVKRLNKEEYDITILSSIPNNNSLRQEFEKYAIVYDLTSFIEKKYWLAFVNYIIEKNNINMIFCTNSMFGYSCLNYLKACYPSIPIFDYVHMEEWYYRDGGYARMSSNYKNVIDKTLVCNKGTEKVITEIMGKKKSEISTVYIGVDPEKFNPEKYDKNELLKKYNIDNRNKYIISYICRISSQKRPFLLFEIMCKVLKNRNDILFVIAGDGEMLSGLKSKVDNEGISDNVIFLGIIKNTMEIYKISDLTLNCSIKEGLALTSYESLSMGVPVISADVGGQKELIDDSVGVIVPCLQKETDINDYDYSQEEVNNYVVAIDKIIENLENYKINSRERIIEKFTLDKMALNMDNEIKKIFANPNKEKIKYGQKLSEDFQHQLTNIEDEFLYDMDTDIYLVREYHKKVYGRYYIDKNGKNIFNSKKELLRDKLWQMPVWRKFVNSKCWILLKKVIRRK